jgi:hypothetical protein
VYQSQSPEYNCTELKQNTVFRVTLWQFLGSCCVQ